MPIVGRSLAGLAGAIGATRVLVSVLPNADTPDARAFAVAAAVLIAAAICACIVPAHVAARLDPMIVLGAE